MPLEKQSQALWVLGRKSYSLFDVPVGGSQTGGIRESFLKDVVVEQGLKIFKI